MSREKCSTLDTINGHLAAMQWGTKVSNQSYASSSCVCSVTENCWRWMLCAQWMLSPSVATVCLKHTLRQVKLSPRCISVSVPPIDKIRKAIPMFSRVGLHFLTVNMPTFTGDFFTPKFKWLRKTESSFVFARVVVSERVDIWVDYYVFRICKLNATIVIGTRIHHDDTFQDGSENAPQPDWI